MSEASRQKIFDSLQESLPESSSLPDLPPTGMWQTFDNPFTQFCNVLETVGGKCFRVTSLSDANERLADIPEWKSGVCRVSVVEGVGESTMDLNAVDDPHYLEQIDFAVLQGHFAVAENGAIWVTDDALRHRVLYFIPQHIALVIPASEIVNNMHEAYGRIKIGDNGFGAFISGPSKTADIEQSLVIGAHGARSLTVFAVENMA